MRILMATNTYLPHVGGVARSVQAFAEEYRKRGHQVLVLAPCFEGMPEVEEDVLRVPAIQNFNGSDFSVSLPLSSALLSVIDRFGPEIVHAHHPFLLGAAGLRIASARSIPIVFTYHTMYERYTHYVPGDSPALKRFAVQLSSGYCNLVDHVIAPSESVAQILRKRGVETAITSIPTGVDFERFSRGDGRTIRRRMNIPENAYVVGHVGRLAPEKNLMFLARSAARFLRKHPDCYFLLVGSGPSVEPLQQYVARHGPVSRVRFCGPLSGSELIDSYHAMNLFVFASHTETQGMVLVEAMAAGLPVVALDAPGAREVVHDRHNGRLLFGEDERRFARAIQWVYAADEALAAELRENARALAGELTISLCAERALDVYREILAKKPKELDIESSVWFASARVIKTEWDLLADRAQAASVAVGRSRLFRRAVIVRARAGLRRLRRLLDLQVLRVRLLGLECQDADGEPGLVMIQIDGLSRRCLEHAVDRRDMPFLRRLLQREGYALHSFYSGIPSSTPAVQGELFYGERCAVPAFGFFHPEAGRIVVMYEPSTASSIEARLAERHPGLLSGGSSYSNIYVGGARESRFCPASFGWGGLFEMLHPLNLMLFTATHIFSAVRITILLLIELVLATADAISGILNGAEARKEMRLIASRLAITILIRELMGVGVKLDICRGLPIIHLNYLGYDEQAHRRGPGSLFARWSMRGIDRAIERIYRAAARSKRRRYEVWIYSDHGQEETRSYEADFGKAIEQRIFELFVSMFGSDLDGHGAFVERRYSGSVEAERARWLYRRAERTDARVAGPLEPLSVAAVGPFGHVYLRDRLRPGVLRQFAHAIARKLSVPLVLALIEGSPRAWTVKGEVRLPEEGRRILGADHPFYDEVLADLIAALHHPLAGQIVISGYDPRGPCYSFPLERGSHGGPGRIETHGFVMAPRHVSFQEYQQGRSYLRPETLRARALEHLDRVSRPLRRKMNLPTGAAGLAAPSAPLRLSLMTYNVHSCIGTDGRLDVERVINVIRQENPDVVALQEVDVSRRRTTTIDQARCIAQALGYNYHFHGIVHDHVEEYGNAVLSRHPLSLVKEGLLPARVGDKTFEQRGVVWLSVWTEGREVQIIATHLGLNRRERQSQIKALLSSEWLLHPHCKRPVVVLGDFNTYPGTSAYRLLTTELVDVQRSLKTARSHLTWPSKYPFSRLDYVFASEDVRVKQVRTPGSALARAASDHLPLIAELELI